MLSGLLSINDLMLKKYSLFLKLLSSNLSDATNVWLFLALVLGLFARAYFLTQPMRGDESYTFLAYVNGSFRSLFEYSAPNNHVLNTLLIKFFSLFFSPSPASIRFPAFLAGVATIILTFFFSRSLNKNQVSGILAAITTAIFPYLILYSTNARGYSLIVALTLVIAAIAHRFLNQPSRWSLFWLALFSALGMLTIPIMILPIAGICLWLLVLLLLNRTSLKEILRQFILPFGTLSGIFTLVFYAPVIFVSGLAPIISNKFVKPLGWDVFFTEFFPQLERSFDELSRDIHPVALLAIFFLALIGIIGSIKTRNWRVLLLLPCLLLGAFFILLLQRAIPYARTWIFLIPFILMLADAGLTFLLKQLPSRVQISVHAIIFVIAFFFIIHLTANNIIADYADTSGFSEASMVVKYLKPIFKPGDTLRVSPTADWPVYFYFWYDGMSPLLDQSAPSTGRIFFIRKKSRGPMGQAALEKLIPLLDMGNMVLYQGKK